MNIYELNKVSVVLNGKAIVKDIDLQIKNESTVVIMGKSGAGKTTLLDLLFGFLKPRAGKLNFLGKPVEGTLTGKVGYLISEPERYFFETTVLKEVKNTVNFSAKFGGKDLESEARKYLRLCGLGEEFDKRDPLYLSRGEKRKVAIASVLASGAEVLLLDEPFSGLDYESTVSVVGALKQLKEGRYTVICCTHDLEPLLIFKPDVYFIEKSKLKKMNLDNPTECVMKFREGGFPPPERLVLASELERKGIKIPVETSEKNFINRVVEELAV